MACSETNFSGMKVDPQNLEYYLRQQLPNAKRILIKVGTNVVTQKDRSVALGRIARIVEQIADLKIEQQKEIILVSSGAVGLGSRVLLERPSISRQLTSTMGIGVEKRASAAIGQARLMTLYDCFFSQKNLSCSQILLEHKDLSQPHISKLAATCLYLLENGVIPILNENDVTNLPKSPDVSLSTPLDKIPTQEKPLLTDNDALACILAGHLKADLVILLTDVDGVYNIHPSLPDSKVISLIDQSNVKVSTTGGSVNGLGRGGMEAKLAAVSKALNTHVPAILIASGFQSDSIALALRGENVGTLIVGKNLPQKLSKL